MRLPGSWNCCRGGANILPSPTTPVWNVDDLFASYPLLEQRHFRPRDVVLRIVLQNCGLCRLQCDRLQRSCCKKNWLISRQHLLNLYSIYTQFILILIILYFILFILIQFGFWIYLDLLGRPLHFNHEELVKQNKHEQKPQRGRSARQACWRHLLTRNDSQWLAMTRNDSQWLAMTRNESQWVAMSRNAQATSVFGRFREQQEALLEGKRGRRRRLVVVCPCVSLWQLSDLCSILVPRFCVDDVDVCADVWEDRRRSSMSNFATKMIQVRPWKEHRLSIDCTASKLSNPEALNASTL